MNGDRADGGFPARMPGTPVLSTDIAFRKARACSF